MREGDEKRKDNGLVRQLMAHELGLLSDGQAKGHAQGEKSGDAKGAAYVGVTWS